MSDLTQALVDVGFNVRRAEAIEAALVGAIIDTAQLADGAVTTAKIEDGAVTNAKLADMAQATLKGRASGAGTGDPTDLTASQSRTVLGLATTDNVTLGALFLDNKGGSEGGELQLIVPASGHSLNGTHVAFDINANSVRIFETGSPFRGFAVNLTSCASGAGTNLLTAGGLTLLNSGTVTNAATLDIVLTSFTSYRGFQILLSGFIPATDAVALQMRVSTNGGSSYDSGASDYRYASWGFSNGGSGLNQSSAAAQIQFGGAEVGNGAAEGLDAEILLLNQTSAAIKPRISGRVWVYTSIDQAAHQVTSGHRNAAQDTDAIRFLFSSGNISSGKWALYGYA